MLCLLVDMDEDYRGNEFNMNDLKTMLDEIEKQKYGDKLDQKEPTFDFDQLDWNITYYKK
jgi:hypothetical protein